MLRQTEIVFTCFHMFSVPGPAEALLQNARVRSLIALCDSCASARGPLSIESSSTGLTSWV